MSAAKALRTARSVLARITSGSGVSADALAGEAKAQVDIERLYRVMTEAINNNPYERPAMATPPTVVVATTADATAGLSAAVPMVTSGTPNALTAAALSRVAWYGGVPTAVTGAHVGLPVSSASPADGNHPGLGFRELIYLNAAFEIETDSDVVEFCLYGNTSKVTMFQVDGVYVDKAGTSFLNASSSDHFVKLTFASRKRRRIRGMISSTANNAALVRSIRIKPTCGFWKPDQAPVLRCGWAGDSYSEGNPYGWGVPNGAWNTLACELLGIRDCRQIAVGGTGYVAVGTPARRKFVEQIPFWLTAQAPWDLIVIAHGFNDAFGAGQPAAVIQAEVVACVSLIRSAHPRVPIVILGSQSGARNLNAATLAVEAGIAAGVAQLADPFCKFVPVSTAVDPWLRGTGYVGATNGSGNSDVYIGPDGVHPSVPGHEYLAYRAAGGIRDALQQMLTH